MSGDLYLAILLGDFTNLFYNLQITHMIHINPPLLASLISTDFIKRQ